MKRSKKDVFAGILLFGAAFLLSACAVTGQKRETGKAPAQEAGTEAAGKETGPKIGVSIYRYDDTFMKLYRSELKQYLEETYHAQVVLRNADGNQETQNQQVDRLIADGCKGLLVNPVEVSAAGRLADAANKAGIPLIFINREPKQTEQLRWKKEHMAVSSVGTDSRQAGSYQGEIILETPKKGDLNGDGVVSCGMLKGEEGNEASEYRSEYAIKALKKGGMKAEELYSGSGDWSRESGKKLAREAFSRYGNKIEVMFCSNDAMANGALEAAKEAGLVPGKDIYLVGVDALQDTVESIKSGEIAGTVLNDHGGQARLAADTLIKMINGEEAETRYLVDDIKITTVSTFKTRKGDD
ncbi:galactose ABC transporter substrate-binding protein [Lacrimispora sp. JR3]|uniref:galactose ABC transporter substrate-binding protein n=1 Tax=Lacrimispora sinapis TaxID=3111456 RepID=UPI0037488C66